MHYITYAQLVEDTLALGVSLPRSIAGVLGIPRSGMLPATILSQFLNVPLGSFDHFLRTGCFAENGNRLLRSASTGNVLVIDDSIYQGQALLKAQQQWAEADARGYQPIWAAVYASPESPDVGCRTQRTVPAPRYFAWNLMQHPDLSQAMSDIDGVLCLDPTVYDDDGPIYSSWLSQAVPLHIPRVPVHTLISMRLDKWRPQTTEWLNRNGVQYAQLILCPAPTPSIRRQLNYGQFKGQHYRDSDCTLFVESDASQAPDIAKYSGKPVICLADGKVY